MITRDFRDKKIPLLGLGTMRLPVTDKKSMTIDEEKSRELLDYALSHGVNYIDTAYMYHNGTAEGFLGTALEKYDRKSYYLATKLPVWLGKSDNDFENIFEEQLSRLRTDYFDFYLCHNLTESNFSMVRKHNIYEFLLKKKEEGIIRHIGFSFHDTPVVLDDIVSAYPWEFVQIQCNYIDWEFQNAKRQYEILTKQQLPIIIMEPLRGGALATLTEESGKVLKEENPDASLASWGFRFLAQFPNVMTVLSGMSDLEQLQDNIATLSSAKPLTEKENAALKKATDIYKKNKTIPCTGCGYCMDCKQGVDIPHLFALANNHLLGASCQSLKLGYEAMKRSARESNCTSCGNCMEHCPQKINIPMELEHVGKLVQNAYNQR